MKDMINGRDKLKWPLYGNCLQYLRQQGLFLLYQEIKNPISSNVNLTQPLLACLFDHWNSPIRPHDKINLKQKYEFCFFAQI